MMRAAVFAGLLIAPVPALAEVEIWPRDAACEPVLTVQSRLCTVTNYFRCPYGEGSAYRLEVNMPEDYDDISASLLTSGGDLIAYGDQTGSWRGSIKSPRNPPTDLAALQGGKPEVYTEVGVDYYDGAPETVRTRSEFRLIADEVEIDGHKLRKIDVILHDIIWGELSDDSGVDTLYYSPVFGFPILGETGGVDGDGPYSDDSTPVGIILPGQPGFGSTTPTHDCGDLSQLSVPSKRDAA